MYTRLCNDSRRDPGALNGMIMGQESKMQNYVSSPALGPTQPPVQWVLGVSRG